MSGGSIVCSADSSVFTERVRRPDIPPPPAWISLSATPGSTQTPCNGQSPRTFTVYWAASSGAHHYEIEESNHVTGVTPRTPIHATGDPPVLPTYLSLTRSKIPPDTYTTYWYQVRACNATGGDEGCSGWRSQVEMCVGNSGGGGGRVVSTTYYHTDALGSPVAESNAAGAITKRSRYEPYGLPADGTFPDAPGYTGHVADSFTQLSYMQQRYYDPVMGRFLSVDPVETNPETGENFNRYWYANNSPYRFIDPDGRAGCDSGSINCKSPGVKAFLVDANARVSECPECDQVLETRRGILKDQGETLRRRENTARKKAWQREVR